MAIITGTVLEEGVPVSRTVRAYSRSTGALAGSAVSDINGDFQIGSLNSLNEYYVVALDDTGSSPDYNAIIFDRIAPVVPAGAHRYWRITNVSVPGTNLLEISELQLFEGGNPVNALASKSSSHVPTEPFSNLFDGSLTTRCYWSNAVVESGTSFWIKWDFGSGFDTKVDGVKQGGFDNSGRYMDGFTLQWSDDNAAWTTLGSKAGLSYPGNNTLSSLYTFP